jgi:hypothetical protein
MGDHLLFLPGVGSSDESTAGHLAAATGLSPADARLLVRSLYPRRLGAYGTAEEAEDRALALRCGGFDAFVVPKADLDRALFPRIGSARFEGGGVAFTPSGAFGPGGLRLIVRGEYRSGRDVIVRHVARSSKGRLVHERTERERSSEDHDFVHLYGADPRVGLELRAREFEYRSALGPRFGPTAAANLRTFIELLRETFPQAVYEDLLLRRPPPPDFDSQTTGVGTTTETRTEDNEKPARTASFLMAWRLLRPS